MIKNVLTEEITRINNIIHGNKLLTESIIESSLIKNIIKKSIKTVIDEVVYKSLKNETLSGGKDNLIFLIKMRGSDAVYNELTIGTSEISKEVLRKSINTLKEAGYDHIDDNTIRAQISNELNTESSRNEIKASVKKEIDAAKSKLENIKKPIDNTKPKVEPKVEPTKKFSDWIKGGKSKFEFKPNTKPSDLGIVPTSEMKAELQVLENSLNEQSKKTLLDYFKKGGKATADGIKKLIKIGFLDKNGKASKRKLWIWGSLLVVGGLYAIGKWVEDNPETQEDDNLIDDGGSDDNKTTSDDNKTTTDDNKLTINKPTDGKPTGGGTTGGGTTGGGTTGGGNTYDTEYDMPGYNAVDLDWNKLKM